MDFATRNLYRSVIEELARGSQATEHDIARALVQAAAGATPPTRRERDPGLPPDRRGRRAFEARLGFRPPLRDSACRAGRPALGAPGYIGAMLGTAAVVLAGRSHRPSRRSARPGRRSWCSACSASGAGWAGSASAASCTS
jgi:cyclic beta-1,2-glucan synthetase